MTHDDVKKLTDAELVAAVAEKVMGWREGVMGKNAGFLVDASGKEMAWNCGSDKWDPLTDWNVTFQVVEAMRAKGEFLQRDAEGSGIRVFFWPAHEGKAFLFERCESGKERRAILEAALLAVHTED